MIESNNVYMHDHFINQLKELLEGELPGKKAQNKMSPNVRFTGKIIPNRDEIRESSVLILLYMKDNQLHIPFTQRPKYNGAHSGQISLPGGKVEPQDKNLLETALRETHEEIGVTSENLQILGSLTPTYIPNSNFNVTPYIAYTKELPTFIPDSYEVEKIIEAPLNDLISPEALDIFIRTINGHNIKAPYFNINNHQIWGATAMIISELKEIINTLLDSNPLDSCNAHNDQVSL